MQINCEKLTKYLNDLAEIAGGFRLESTLFVHSALQKKKELEEIIDEVYRDRRLFREEKAGWEKYEVLDTIEFNCSSAKVKKVRILPENKGYIALSSSIDDHADFCFVEPNGKSFPLMGTKHSVQLNDFQISANGETIVGVMNEGLVEFKVKDVLDYSRILDNDKKLNRPRKKPLELAEKAWTHCVSKYEGRKTAALAIGKEGYYVCVLPDENNRRNKSMIDYYVGTNKKKSVRIYDMEWPSSMLLLPKDESIYSNEIRIVSGEVRMNLKHCPFKGEDTKPDILLDHWSSCVQVSPEGKYLVTVSFTESDGAVLRIFDITKSKTIREISGIIWPEAHTDGESIMLDEDLNIYLFTSKETGGRITKIGRKPQVNENRSVEKE
jgi:WD40 repeat protein